MKKNLPHSNKKMERVYPDDEIIQKLQYLDKLQLYAPYKSFPFTRDLAEQVLNFSRKLSKKIEIYFPKSKEFQFKLFKWRIQFIRWYFGPQEQEYIAIFPGYNFGFYDVPRGKKKYVKKEWKVKSV